LVVFEAVPPLSKIGQVLFWPQNYVSFFHLSSHSVFGVRIMMSISLTVLSLLILLFLRAFGTKPWNRALLRNVPGILAILGPLVGWLFVGQLDWVVRVLMSIETATLCAYTLYLFRKRRNSAAWTVPLVLVVCFGFWAFLYWRYLDPVTLIIPIVGCLSYLAWVIHLDAFKKTGVQAEGVV
jgi:hypothetical protein